MIDSDARRGTLRIGRTARLRGGGLVPAVLLATVLGCDDGDRSQQTAPVPVAERPRGEAPESPESPEAASAGTPDARPRIDEQALRAALGIGDAGDLQRVGNEIRGASLAGTQVTDLGPLKGQPLRHLDLRGTLVKDLSPLKGMPLKHLFLEQTQVENLAPLAGMPLEQLYLIDAPVADVSPLASCPLHELNLCGTKVVDVTPLAKLPLRILWLQRTPLSDLSPLAGSRLASLDVQESQVRDLGPVAKIGGLERLNIARTPVTDLRPLAGLGLTRLLFTPATITEGLDVVKRMPTLTELDVEFREPQRLAPAEFWARHAAGEFDAKPAAAPKQEPAP